MMSLSSLYTTFLSLTLLLCTLRRALVTGAIVDGPNTVTAMPGQWVNFTCSVECTHVVDWYVEGYSSDISEICLDDGNDMMVCTRTTQVCSTTMSTTTHIEQLSIMATNQIAGDKIAIQCAAISKTYDPSNTCVPYVEYTRLAYLNVDSPVTVEPTPAVCPTQPQHEPVTVVVTQIITPSPVVVIHTVTSLSSVLVTVNSPDCTPATAPPAQANQSSGVGRIHLSSLLSELFTWLCTLVTALAFL